MVIRPEDIIASICVIGLISCQPRRTQHDRHQAQMDLIVQGHTVDRFMPVEDNAIAIVVDEPDGRIDKEAFVGR